MPKVSFIGIGAQKCATTWLYNCLSQHPQLHLPYKEMNFFSMYYDQGTRAYESAFAQANTDHVCGDITPNYACFDQIPQRIFEYNPHMKLVFLVRDPAERAVSQYKMQVRFPGEAYQ